MATHEETAVAKRTVLIAVDESAQAEEALLCMYDSILSFI